MTKLQRTDFSFLFNEIAQSLDISDSMFEEVEKKYQAVGKWLGEKDSPLSSFSPEIYPQGSFCLGTVIKPLGDNDDYDIDVVFELAISKDKLSQKRLKNLVGDRLKANETYRQMLDDEGRRCWTLKYADSAKFHLDILPAIPNNDYTAILKQQGLSQRWDNTNIAITDKTLPNYDEIDLNWPRSNPKGYAAWFREQMIVQYEFQKKQLAEAFKADIESVPDFRIKTPLQRSVQLLKRHRDIAFKNDQDDQDDKPASIIITTLAAQAYNNDADIVDSLINIVDRMPSYITKRGGISWVQNPTDPLENFADRWQERPQREQKFRNWLNEVRADLDEVLRCDDIDRAGKLLEELFGEKVAMATVSKFKESMLAKGKTINPVVTIVNPNKPWRF